jgi:p-hydroxybenzoate 3-monooxygenase
VFIDLANARERDRADIRFGIGGTQVIDLTSDQQAISVAAPISRR